MRLMTLTVCLGFIVSFGLTSAIAQESDGPFIYYYSIAENAIVIQRVDGGDQRVMPEPTSDSGDLSIWGLYWSESGEWLDARGYYGTWLVRYDFEESIYLDDVYRVSIERGEYSTEEFDWDGSIIFSVRDLWTHQYITGFTVPNGTSIQTSRDGLYHYYVEDDKPEIVIILRDGERFTRSFFPISEYNASSVRWCGDGLSYFHPERKILINENFTTGEIREIDQPFETLSCINWNSNGDYGLVSTYLNGYGEPTLVHHQLVVGSENRAYDFGGEDYSTFGLTWIGNTDWIVARRDYDDGVFAEIRFLEIQSDPDGYLLDTLFSVNDSTVEFSDDGTRAYILNERGESLFDLTTGQLIAENESYAVAQGWGSPFPRYTSHIEVNSEGDGEKFIQDRLTGERYDFPFHPDFLESLSESNADVGGRADWHPDGEWVIFYEVNDYICYFSFANAEGDTYIEFPESYICEYPTGVIYPRWVPDNVPLDNIR